MEWCVRLCDKIKNPIPNSILEAADKIKTCVPKDFYLMSITIKDIENFMRKIIDTFMNKFRSTENKDKIDVQIFLDMLEPLIVITFLRYFNYQREEN